MGWKERAQWALGGAAVAWIVLALLVGFYLQRATESQEQTISNLTAVRVQFDEAMRLLQSCQAREAELTSSATVLYEWERGKGFSVLEGLIEIQPGAALGGDAYGQTRVRWGIPYKVKPVVYGNGQGTAYAWVNLKTKTVEGPFAPEVSR